MIKQYYSPLRYPGGKTSLFNFLERIIECNRINRCKYVEGFAGGAGAALKLLMHEVVEDIYLNDLDPLVYAFWKALVQQPENLCRLIQDTSVNISEWEKRHRIFENKEHWHNISELDLGFTGFFLNRCNRSGIFNAGPIGGKQQAGKWKINARYNQKELIQRIQKIALYRDRINLFNKDASTFLRWLQLQNLDPREVLCYLDPPYVAQGRELYEHYFTEKQHKQLANYLQRQLNYHWIVSYDDHPLIHQSYKEVSKNIFEFNYYANQTKLGRELVICSKRIILPSKYEHYSRTKEINQESYVIKAII